MTSTTYVTTKPLARLGDIIDLHNLDFGRARYLLNRALEVRTAEGFQFERPILEIGCGDGSVTALFFQAPLDYGVEIMPLSDKYHNMYGQVDMIDPANNRLPYEDLSMGSIYSMSVLEHVKFLQPLLDESFRVLKPNGCFVANVNTDKCAHDPFCFSAKYCPNLLSPGEWQERFERAGFVVEKIVPAIPPWLEISTRNLSFVRGIHRKLIHRLLFTELWTRFYEEAGRYSSVETDLTVTLFARKPSA